MAHPIVFHGRIAECQKVCNFNRNLSMTNTRHLFQRVRTLFSSERYRHALKEIERAGAELLADSKPSRGHQDLLLLVANVYCANRKYQETRWYLSELENRYADIHERVGWITLQLKLFLKEGHTWLARELLEEWRSGSAPDACRPVLDFYHGVVYFRTRNYIAANRCFHGCYRRCSISSNPTLLGDTLYMLGLVAFRRMLFDTAERYFNAAIEQFDLSGRNRMLGTGCRLAATSPVRVSAVDQTRLPRASSIGRPVRQSPR